MNVSHSAAIIAVVALVTLALRVSPFLVFGGKRNPPEIISYLGRVLPFAVMGMLVVYCFKNVSFISFPFGIPELIAGVTVALLHIWKKNTLISIVGGTVLYMVLVQTVFI